MTFCPWWNECELLIQVAGAAAQCLGIGDKRGGGVVCHESTTTVSRLRSALVYAKTEERRREGGVQKLIRFNVLQHDSTATAKVQIQLWPSQICRRQIYGLEGQKWKMGQYDIHDKDTHNMRLSSPSFFILIVYLGLLTKTFFKGFFPQKMRLICRN